MKKIWELWKEFQEMFSLWINNTKPTKTHQIPVQSNQPPATDLLIYPTVPSQYTKAAKYNLESDNQENHDGITELIMMITYNN